MHFIRSLLIMIVILTIIPASVSYGFASQPEDGGIDIKADRMNHDTTEDVFNAEGHVVIQWEGMTLNSDQAAYNRKTGMLVATGNVVMIKDDDVMRGTRFTFNVANEKGELENGTLTSTSRHGNFIFTGKKIVRVDQYNLLFENTELTTCDMPDPSWKFAADKLKVNLLGYAIGKSITFYIKDVPVLYIPWAAFPAVRDRRSGVLFPRFGYSNTRGFQVDVPVYWAISPNQDLLVDLDLQSKRGVGIGSEYRYARKRGSEGNIGGYLIYDQHVDRWRGQIIQNHKEIISSDFNLRMSIDEASDRNYLREFGEKSGEYNRQSSVSTVNILKTWQNNALSLYLRNSQDYYATDNSHTLQTLPEISLATVRQKIAATPLYFDLDATAANLYQKAGPSGQLLLTFPRLSLVTSLPEYINATAFAGVHLRGYSSDNIPAGSGINGRDADILPEVGVRVSSSLSRIYTIDGESLKKLRHELVPEADYDYKPHRNEERHPFYDYEDRLALQNMVTYSLTSHLGGKYQNGEVTEYRDLMRLKIMQGYNFSGTRRDLLTMVDANRPLTDLMLESDTWLHPMLRLTLDSRYNVYDRRIASVDPGLEFDDKRGNTAGVSYRMARNELEYLETRLATKMIRPWTFGYATRYSFDRPGFLESVYSAEYQQKCWSVSIALIDRPGNTAFHINFNLAGLTGR
ncbi:MAG: LPS assembly protein LptD [Deltaproteobacteria bacterium]